MKAVIFDFDGLILDTETNEFLSMQHVFEARGLKLTLEVWKDGIGTDASAFNPYAYLEQCLGHAIDREQARTERRRKFAELMEGEKARPGVEAYLQRASELGLSIGLASSSSSVWVENYLHQLGLRRFFHCVKTSDDVEKVKPDPQLYLEAIRSLGVLPREAIAFEDSPNGALAAVRAGMHCVIVPNNLTKTLNFGLVGLRMESMADMSLDEVIGLLENNNQASG